MKNIISVIALSICIHTATSFMKFRDFQDGSLRHCYSMTLERNNNQNSINGQELPLPSSIETFVSLLERVETNNPNLRALELARKLLMSFRIDDLPSGLKKVWSLTTGQLTDLERILFNIPKALGVTNNFKEDDFSSDDECALHFMLSHSVNESLAGDGNEETLEEGIAKFPREFGVVSLNARWKHAFALGKVLLGIMSGLSGNNVLDATDIFGKLRPGEQEPYLNGVKFSRLFASTFGELVAVTINNNFQKNNIIFQPNGIWNDASCTTVYTLEENKKQYITTSLIRGTIDGLIIGNALEKSQDMQKLRLSQILRMYYGSEGLSETGRKSSSAPGDIQWCNRKRNFELLTSQLREEIENFNKLYSSMLGSKAADSSNEDINAIINFISTSTAIFEDVNDGSDCSFAESNSVDKKCATPFSIFPILDINTPILQKSFQIELLGNLSVNFDIRPRGNTVGAYSNVKPILGRGLDIVANNSGISGCPSCFVRYYDRRNNKLDDVELMERLNQTLTDYVEEFDEDRSRFDESESGAPSKVILLFNYQGQVNNDQRLRDAVWEIEKNFREATILAIGSRKDNLGVFTIDDNNDVFTESSNAAEFANKLKNRICKVPAEFQYKECALNTRTGKSNAYVSLGKLQYWAMYPKYFLKSFYITMKFVPLDGAQIRVCFSRTYNQILDGSAYCLDSAVQEVIFTVKNPCRKYNEYNCHPFYFSVEGKKWPNSLCESPRCRTSNDIQFEFQHEGISCNAASMISFSALCMLLSALLYFIQKQ